MSPVHQPMRSLHRQAQIHTTEMLARVCQPEPAQMCAIVEDEPASRRIEIVCGLVLLAIGLIGAWLAGWLP